jgi:ABC-type nitrate/sulfonate/bicarbonate transport system ATPase subunit
MVLRARGLVVARDKRVLLQGIDLTLRRGEVVAILGPNGVGKSTLLATLAGLLPAGGGELITGGRVAAALQAPAMARRSVQANVEAALGWWGVPRGERPARARRALASMQVEGLAGQLATSLSGGQARRVHLARALALDSSVLLLDEPFAGLDPVARAELLGDAGRALRDPSRATLVVLHDRAEAWALADRLLVLLGDGIAADGPPHDLLERPPTREVAEFLGFTGSIVEPGDAVRCVRPAHVALDPAGPTGAVITRVVPEEDGVLCDAQIESGADAGRRGTVQLRAPHPGPSVGERVRLRIDGGVTFTAAGAST